MPQDTEVMELLDKLKKASKAPEQAARRIKALDAMVHRLKANRRACQEAIDADEEKLKWIVREEASIHVRLDPLAKTLSEREATCERMRKQIEESVNQFQTVISESSSRITKTRMYTSGHTKKGAIQELRAERGFSMAPSASPHKAGRPKGFEPRGLKR